MGYLNVPTNLGSSNQAGRPARVKPVVLHAPDTPEGFVLGNVSKDPAIIKQVNETYLKGKVPPGLTPGRGLPDHAESLRRRKISAGWARPKGYA